MGNFVRNSMVKFKLYERFILMIENKILLNIFENTTFYLCNYIYFYMNTFQLFISVFTINKTYVRENYLGKLN